MSDLSERDICSKYVLPALRRAGWDLHTQIREEVFLTDGKIVVSGSQAIRGRRKRADYVLYLKPNMPLAVIEVKSLSSSAGSGMQQALEYAEMLKVPFAFSTNGKCFVLHDGTGTASEPEKEVPPDEFPTPAQLWEKYCVWRGIPATKLPIVLQDFHTDGAEQKPRYYQSTAINRAVEEVAKGNNRLLLVMATGTGKTYTAFQIAWRLWSSRAKKRILFLADRNILVDQARTGDFRPFGSVMTKVGGREIDPSYEVYLSLYQAVTGESEEFDIYRRLSPGFFDLIIVDECHRGSAAEDAAWRGILEYFATATQIGLTATPKETERVSNSAYFGDPVFTYSLRQGIEDGFLAPYKVVRFDLDRDFSGFRPEVGALDRYGREILDRVYLQQDFDKHLVIDERTRLVARKVTDYLTATNRYDKTIVFCEDTEHADRMRLAFTNENADITTDNRRYVMRITGDDPVGKAELENFIDPASENPVIATTSKLLTTGVDTKTCKLIVLDQSIRSVTEFKQIIGRGTRVDERNGKLFFTIMDFRRATQLFADPAFDGDPVQVIEADGATLLRAAERESQDEILRGPGTAGQSNQRKYYVDGVEVSVIATTVQYLGSEGELISESMRSYAQKILGKRFSDSTDFTSKWLQLEKKRTFIEELERNGVSFHALREEIPNGVLLSDFDIVLCAGFGVAPTTREHRADRLRRTGIASWRSDSQRRVLESLLDVFVEGDYSTLESPKVLQLPAFSAIGTPVEIVSKIFGGREDYQSAIKALESALFQEGSGV